MTTSYQPGLQFIGESRDKVQLATIHSSQSTEQTIKVETQHPLSKLGSNLLLSVKTDTEKHPARVIL